MAARMNVVDEEELALGGWDATGFARQALASKAALAAVMDHTLLQPDATRAQALRLCAETVEHGFACAMVNPVWAALAHAELAGAGIPVGSMVGYPHGVSLSTTKRDEAAALIRIGVHELDMALSLGLLKSGDNAAVRQEIRSVVEIAHEAGAVVTVTLETCMLTVEEKLRSSELAIAAGADFLKTSSGFSLSGATVDDVALLRGVAGSRCGIKASNGIRDLADARRMLEAGASRIGSSAAAILAGLSIG